MTWRAQRRGYYGARLMQGWKLSSACLTERRMTDPRIDKLAHLLINYSCEVKAGEVVLVEAIDVPHAFTKALVRETAAAGGRPLVLLKSNEVQRAMLLAGSPEQWATIAEVERAQMERVQCYIGAR